MFINNKVAIGKAINQYAIKLNEMLETEHNYLFPRLKILNLICRQSNKRIVNLEKEKEQNKVPQQIVTENLLTPGTPSSGLQPKGLDFTTPRSSTHKKRQPSALLMPSTPRNYCYSKTI